MKKIILVLFFFSILTPSKSINYISGDIIENNFKISHGVTFELPKGKFILFDKWKWFYGNVTIRDYGLIKVENNIVSDVIYISELNTGAQYIGYLSQWVEEIFFKDKYDGCYERPEYYLVKYYKRGMSYNCMVVRHLDANKELYSPDDPHTLGPVKLRNWLINNPSITFSDTFLTTYHRYYSARASGIAYSFNHSINPEFYGGPITNFSDEKQSEYHKNNINNYPEVKNFMDKWVAISSLEHEIFEENVRSRKEHQLEFRNISNATFDKQNNDDNLIDKILELKKLLDEGIITNEEFTKMKKRILN